MTDGTDGQDRVFDDPPPVSDMQPLTSGAQQYDGPRAQPYDGQVTGAYATQDGIRAERLVQSRRTPPKGGWRRLLYRLTFGALHLGESKAEVQHRDLIVRIRRPVPTGHHRVAVMSFKGGVGKTTTTLGLG